VRLPFLSPLYLWLERWAHHPRATWALGASSFAESSFFPIPPDILLAPMCLARPQRAWFLATVTTVTSVVGGLFGYVIGAYFFHWISPSLEAWGYAQAFELAKEWFLEWGFWTIVLAGFVPIPYKVCTITAGAMGMPIAPFVIASVIGRGKRFYLVAAIMRWSGNRFWARLGRAASVNKKGTVL